MIRISNGGIGNGNTTDLMTHIGRMNSWAKPRRWSCSVLRKYDDGGYSGGTLERPALQELLKDIENAKIDCVVVYKIDRFSRHKIHKIIFTVSACDDLLAL